MMRTFFIIMAIWCAVFTIFCAYNYFRGIGDKYIHLTCAIIQAVFLMSYILLIIAF